MIIRPNRTGTAEREARFVRLRKENLLWLVPIVAALILVVQGVPALAAPRQSRPTTATVATAPRVLPGQSSAAPEPSSEGCGCACSDDCEGCEGCGDRSCRSRTLADYCRSPCDMVQHYSYFPSLHGYYYFRPYNVSQLLQQRTLVTQWGGDPRNPYTDGIFDRVYEELKKPGAPATSPRSKSTALAPPPKKR